VLLLAQLSASSASWQHLKVSLDVQQRGGRFGGDTEFVGSNAVLAAGVAKQAALPALHGDFAAPGCPLTSTHMPTGGSKEV
jgi:hypothetical protein